MRYRAAVALVAMLSLTAGCAQGPSSGSADRGIVFSSSRDGDFEIYVMNAEGGEARQLTHNASRGPNEADDYVPAWSPDGRRVVFASTRDHDGDGFDSQEVYVMAADGSGQMRLTENQSGDGPLGWSPDGESLLYLRRAQDPATEGEAPFELALMKPDGTGTRVLAAAGGLLTSAAFSPDGARLAYTRCDEADDELDCEIWVADADGSGASKLVDSDGRDSGAAWSPDGERIAFTSDRDRNGDCFFSECWGHNGEIYVMNADGSDQTRLTDDPGDDASPTWSPDGERIAFAGLRDVDGAVDAPEENLEIYVMDNDGSNLRQLTDSTAWDWQPDWN